jgi:hypothetical protein
MEKNIREAISIIEDVRRTLPECTYKAFLNGAIRELNEALELMPIPANIKEEPTASEFLAKISSIEKNIKLENLKFKLKDGEVTIGSISIEIE